MTDERRANTMPISFSPDGRSIAVMTIGLDTGYDVGVVNAEDGTIRKLVSSGANENYPEFSPDGRWIAYGADRTGRFEVNVMRADGTAARTVSTEGGVFPRWAPDATSPCSTSTRGTAGS